MKGGARLMAKRRKIKGEKKLRRLTAVLLPLLAATQMCFPAPKTQSKKIPLAAFGIESKPSYTEAELETILNIFFEETESGIEKAFNEGYKQGVLEYAPKAAGLEAVKENLQAECRKMRTRRILQDTGIGLSCFAAGFLTSELIKAVK